MMGVTSWTPYFVRSASTRLEAALGETLLGDFTANAYAVIVLSSTRQQNLIYV